LNKKSTKLRRKYLKLKIIKSNPVLKKIKIEEDKDRIIDNNKNADGLFLNNNVKIISVKK